MEESPDGKQIGILVAVEEERRAVSRRLAAFVLKEQGRGNSNGLMPAVQSKIQNQKSKISTPERPLVWKSGMGAERARQAAVALCAQHSLQALIIAGFAAGLSEKIAPGDLVIAREVAQREGSVARLLPDPALLAAFSSISLPGVSLHFGGLLTADRIVTRAAEKSAIARRFPDCLAMDMETAGAAQAAQAAGVPWIAVRAITDGLHDDFPLAFDRYVDATGDVSRARIAAAVLLRLWKIPALIRLGARSARAAGNLAACVELFMQVTADGRDRSVTG